MFFCNSRVKGEGKGIELNYFPRGLNQINHRQLIMLESKLSRGRRRRPACSAGAGAASLCVASPLLSLFNIQV